MWHDDTATGPKQMLSEPWYENTSEIGALAACPKGVYILQFFCIGTLRKISQPTNFYDYPWNAMRITPISLIEQ
jgi:hypothetical protein